MFEILATKKINTLWATQKYKITEILHTAAANNGGTDTSKAEGLSVDRHTRMAWDSQPRGRPPPDAAKSCAAERQNGGHILV